jgi:Domain of unknown function (DUF6398)
MQRAVEATFDAEAYDAALPQRIRSTLYRISQGLKGYYTGSHEHLNEDYRVLAQRMTAALCRKRPSPFASGRSGEAHDHLRAPRSGVRLDLK